MREDFEKTCVSSEEGLLVKCIMLKMLSLVLSATLATPFLNPVVSAILLCLRCIYEAAAHCFPSHVGSVHETVSCSFPAFTVYSE